MLNRLKNILIFFTTLCWGVTAYAQQWPQEIKTQDATIIIYQPQPDVLDGNTITGRAAISIERTGKDPVFGASWFKANIATDKDNGMASIYGIQITNMGWPESSTEKDKLTAMVKDALATTELRIDLESLSQSIAASQKVKASIEGINNDPPKITFSKQVAVLLSYDGEPKFAPIKDSKYQRAENTAFAVIKDTTYNSYYLTDGKLWFKSDNPLTDWEVTPIVPGDLSNLIPKPDNNDKSSESTGANNSTGTNGSANSDQSNITPQIIATTVPTELVVTAGEPNWKTLPNSNLLYVDNTLTPWVRDVADKKMYILLSGRWFSALTEAGPWTFVRADKLPESFKSIPAGSDIGGIRVAIAGTTEADNAIIESQIPQTTAIKRKDTTLTVYYDGEPQFKNIAGTSVAYAVNTSSQVLLIGGVYYAVDNGVWFTSKSPTTGWIVADKIPTAQISTIPPTSPVYNVTYVQVYSSTPDVVYVGYTSGYLWSFPYYGVPVYGTGWYYPPYWGGVYYPRTPTWGFNIGYNPWYGWGFGASWSYGFFNIGFGWHSGGRYYNPWRGWNNSIAHNYFNNRNRLYYGNRITKTGDIRINNNINIGNRDRDNDRYNRNFRDNNNNNRKLTDSKLNGNKLTDSKLANNKFSDNKLANNSFSDNRPYKNLSQQNEVKQKVEQRRNIYNSPENSARNAAITQKYNSAKSSSRANNVYADKKGNIARDNGEKWQTLQNNNKWQPAQNARSNVDFNQLNQERRGRERPMRGGRGR